MEGYKPKVYVQVDEKNCILCIEGGYTTPKDITWAWSITGLQYAMN